jgi:hypothetical protein
MNTHSPNKNTQKHFDWREDLAHSRDLVPREIEAFGYVLGWLEDWRVEHDLPPGRDAACRWWREVAKAKVRPAWRLRQWEEAIRWSRIRLCLTRWEWCCTFGALEVDDFPTSDPAWRDCCAADYRP